jgi:predicted flap endonuclease-1-like 5' DNA nuclease
MTLVQRCVVAKTADQDSKLEGLIDKLIALRTEIDATLAELASQRTAAPAAPRLEQLALAAETAEDPYAGLTQSMPPAFAYRRAALPDTEIEALAETTLAPASDEQSHPRGDADVQDTAAEKAEATETPAREELATEFALVDRQPIEPAPDCAEATGIETTNLAADAIAAGDEALAAETGPPKDEAARPAATLPAGLHDDLTRIAAIDADLADRLAAQGVLGYAQIAAWSEGDVARVTEALDLDRRISKENWIEQASLLAAGKSTAFADSRDQVSSADAGPVAEAGDVSPAEVATAAAPAAESATILVFDKSRRRSQEVVAPPRGAAAPVRARRPRRVGTLVLATAAVLLGATALIAAEPGVLGEQTRSVFSSSLRTLLDKVGTPPVWELPRLRDDVLDYHGFQLRQIWPSGS